MGRQFRPAAMGAFSGHVGQVVVILLFFTIVKLQSVFCTAVVTNLANLYSLETFNIHTWNFVEMCSGKAVGALQGPMWSVCLILESKELLLFCSEGWIARIWDLPLRNRLHLEISARKKHSDSYSSISTL